jgi:hypothetical protein
MHGQSQFQTHKYELMSSLNNIHITKRLFYSTSGRPRSSTYHYAVHSVAPFAVFVDTCNTVVVTFCVVVFVPGWPVTVTVATPPPCVMVENFVDVLASKVVLIVEVTSDDLVMYTVCCSAATVCVVVFVLKRLTVAASALTVDILVFVAKLVEKRVVVDGLSVVVLPILEVETTVVYCVAPSCSTVRVATTEVIVVVTVLPLSDVVLVATEA